MTLILIYFIVFIAAGLFTFGLFKDPAKKRVFNLETGLIQTQGEEEGKNVLNRILLFFSQRVKKYEHVGFLKRYLGNLGRMLEYAGIIDQYNPEKYLSLHFFYGVIGFFLSMLCVIAGIRSGGDIDIFRGMALMLIVTGIGFILPYFRLLGMIKARKKAIIKALPFTLDLITISVEAGLDFSGAIERIVQKSEMNELNYEFFLYLHETKLGKRKVEALQRLSDRIDIPTVTTIVTSLMQAEELGMPLGQILRIQSNSLREKRMLLSEKLALEAPTKMLFPLAGFIFPAVFIVLLGPILISFMSK